MTASLPHWSSSALCTTSTTVSKHASNTTVKFADDTIGAGLIFDGDEKVYRNEVATLEQWSGSSHLSWTPREPRRSLWTTETKGDIHSTAIVNSTPPTVLRVEI